MRHEVFLTRARPEDTDIIIAAMNDPKVARWLTSIPQPYGLNDAAEFIANAGPDESAIRISGELAGMLRVGSSLGIWIAPKFQGKGIGLRAAVIGLSRYFLNPENTGIDAVYLKDNHRSAALLAKLGFREQVSVMAWSRAQAKEVPAMSLHLSRDDFAAKHGLTIDTPRLHISGYRPEDLPDLHRIATVPEVARMLLHYFPEMMQDEVAEIFAGDGLTPPIRLVIRCQGKTIGSVGLLAGEPLTFGYFLDPSVSGQGLGKEAVKAFMAEVIGRFGLTELRAGVFDDNPASAKILCNLGFQRVEDVMMPSKGRNAPAPAGVFSWTLQD